ncbi:hypothetical protein PRZ48_010248 [Zasmidium cellare]|uniref:Uncharacterized protein n=1 Tax=Zasmidium cellare TaxID=395010 RepID=A0ABR0E896_ZASCE|nr:hypothetical protein PRZ48_010248 [Zasmidium cellare]
MAPAAKRQKIMHAKPRDEQTRTHTFDTDISQLPLPPRSVATNPNKAIASSLLPQPPSEEQPPPRSGLHAFQSRTLATLPKAPHTPLSTEELYQTSTPQETLLASPSHRSSANRNKDPLPALVESLNNVAMQQRRGRFFLAPPPNTFGAAGSGFGKRDLEGRTWRDKIRILFDPDFDWTPLDNNTNDAFQLNANVEFEPPRPDASLMSIDFAASEQHFIKEIPLRYVILSSRGRWYGLQTKDIPPGLCKRSTSNVKMKKVFFEGPSKDETEHNGAFQIMEKFEARSKEDLFARIRVAASEGTVEMFSG